MRLKRLECYGFKSFADRVSFDFDSGITAIIGPNGCGKSNIVDAIKWVVGEQSAKALRGSEMADVIFNGCATRRAMPVCEVTLTLEDFLTRDGQTQNEVALTRSLTRDGQSNYFINGKPSRLKDIKELLLDTGIGTSAYAVIEQGRVGFILEASTKDRRAILEEASGISRFKVRRKAAMRKLERVQVDLQRITEVHNEVEKRLRTVSRQAEVALRYQELAGTLKELRIIFALEEFGRLRAELEELHKQINQLNDTESGLAKRLGELEASLLEADTRLISMEQEIRAREEERAAVRSRRDVAAAQIEDGKQRLLEIDQQRASDEKGMDGSGDRVAALQNDIAETEARLRDMGGDESQQQDSLALLYRGRQDQLDALIKQIDEAIEVIEAQKSQDVQVLSDIARTEAEQSRLKSSHEALQQRRLRLEENHRSHSSALDEARSVEEETHKAVAEATQMVDAGHARLDELLRQREEANTEAQTIDADLNDLRHKEGQSEARFKMLSDYERRNDGISGGARGVLQQMDRFQGIEGLVADLFGVSAEYELAIETALGPQAQNIVTETQEAAKEAIDFLKRERRGRATFLPLDDIQGRKPLDAGLLKLDGVIGRASDLIDFKKKYKGVFDYLLGNILVVETIEHAINLRRSKSNLYCRMVTVDGEVINPGGAMTGGRYKGKQNLGLVSRKNELRRLEEQLNKLASSAEELAREREVKKKRAFDLAVAVEEQRNSIQQLERDLGEAKAQLMKTERDRLHAEEFTSSYHSELEEISIELKQLEDEESSLKQQHEASRLEKERIEQLLNEQQQKLHELAVERDRQQEDVNNIRVDLATTEERRESLRNHISHLRRQIQEIEDQQQERQQRLDAHAERRQALEVQIEENKASHENDARLFEELSAAVDTLIKDRDQLRNSVEEQRQEERKLSGERRKAEHERQTCELKANEHRVRCESLSERILDEYDIELAEAWQNWEQPEDIDWDGLRKQLQDTEREFNRIGPVNLAAIDELKEVEAREQFLSRQLADLNAAAEKIQQIITDLDDTSRRLFEATYREVRKNFQELFRLLFNGGKADMVLEKDEDILDAGIEIIAQPPSKQPKSISLLSGGEKALTAIALIFAVYKTKPSPFCLLDEVDAPLDESNTDVFANMIRKFCDTSQFIVITHNKRTMQYTDAIYGITHAEPGVSTKISVQLDEVEASDELLETAAGQGPYAS